ncbi:hypothetical protein GCM10011332_31340 [Terasakiella brassicae]|uniref:Uncharacterized protein n=1 Tax=Terasakiella brassicae TaxID=1634917 RepID=A0A917CA48_9PROT|nr:hypothetical protein [Terasakiella brassicae]GGF75030.1 hypothetical protein GCM10011332_31340 [Terasakiella brassicae]
MKVQYKLPIRGMLQVKNVEAIKFENWSFTFETGKDGKFVETLIIGIDHIPKEKWPTLIEVEQDPNAEIPRFPFTTNPDAIRFHSIEETIINLESFLSVYGLEEICFNEMSEEWIPSDDDEKVGLQSGFSISAGSLEPISDPVDNHFLACCIVASNQPSPNVAALSHFRIGLVHFHNGKYIESIRSLYICIETLFGNGKHQKRPTIQEFQKSDTLNKITREMYFQSTASNLIERLKRKYPKLNTATSEVDFYEFLFDLRGEVQHANGFVRGKWHPSKQEEFKDEAVFLFNFTHHICWDIAEGNIATVEHRLRQSQAETPSSSNI